MLDRLVSDFWGLIGMFVVGVVYSFIHRSTAISGAKKIAMTLMLAAEKKAEDLILVTGRDKFNWVVDKGYDMLPAVARMFVGKPMFRTIVQDLLDNTMHTGKSYQVDSPAKTPSASSQAGPSSAMPPVKPIPPVISMPPVKPIPPITAPGNGVAGGSGHIDGAPV